jgi:uncharacterized protein (TIGR02217 family)
MTDVVTLASGHEERNQRWARSRRRYNAGYGVKSVADMRAVLAFFEERRGRFHGFLWRDVLDHSSGGETPTATDQAIGTGDGENTTFQLIKSYGSDHDPYHRAITRPVAGSVRLARDGIEAMGGWSVDLTTGLITFVTAPGAGVAISAGYLFDVPVRFDTDRLDVELTSFDAALAPDIPVIEILP